MSAALKTAGIEEPGLKLHIGMTQADIDKARQGWQMKLKSALIGVGRNTAQHTNSEMSACVAALEILERIAPVDEATKRAQIEASATPPKYKDQGGPLDRPKTGPDSIFQPGADAAKPAATLPPPSKPA